MKKNVIKICEIILCVVLLVGFVGYYKFSTSAEFNPTAARDFNRNIVESKNNQKKEDANSSEGNLWKKDENSMDNEASNADDSSNYTNNNQAEETPQDNAAQQTIASTTESGDNNPQSSEGTTEEDKKTADTVYDVVDGKDKGDEEPDIIIPSEKNPDNTVPAGKDDKVSDNGTVIIKPGDNNSSDIPGGSGNNDKPSSKPEYVPTDEIKDPELVVDDNKYKGGGYINSKPYVDGVITKDNATVDLYPPRVFVSVSDTAFYQLIAGETYSDKYFFYALDTLAIVNGDFNHPYSFYENTYGSDGNFMITEISLDDGNSWIGKFPVTIPENQDSVKVKYAYRFSSKSDWTEEIMNDELPVYKSRIFILNQKVSEDNRIIHPDNIVNTGYQYYHSGDLLFLNYFQENLFKSNNWIDKDGYNTVLFPGWVEDGKKVECYYTATKGRHVLQPIDAVNIPEGINIQLKHYFLEPYDELEYLQTLTSFDNTSMQSLIRRNGNTRTVYVPKYIQAIDLDQSPSSTCAWMEIPDTVMYIDDDTPTYVADGFIVDEDNPYYSSSEDGLLLSKDETEILGIPSGKTSITIEPGIKIVHFSSSSSVKEITILANSIDELPDLDLSRLNNATLHIQSSILNEFVKENYDVLEESGITVTTVADEDISYTFDNSLQIGSDNGLYHSYAKIDSLAVPDSVSSIKSGAFNESSVSTLILPEDGKIVTFEKGSLSGSSVQKVICYTQKQYDEVSRYVNEEGMSDIGVVLSATAKGENFEYQYYVENDVYILVKAITSPEVFNGTITLDGKTIAFTEISAGAFKGNTSLKMVNLNESVKKIGAQAFMNCTNLEGLLINSEDIITIGDKAVDGCNKLRFMASNAYTGVMENDYSPNIRDSFGNSTFYAPTFNEGYNQSATSFTVDSGVFGYAVSENNILYGLDMTFSPYLLLRAGHASGAVNIDPGIQEIIWCAFENLTDIFTISFDSLDTYYSNLYIDSSAFANSGITDVTINKGVVIDDDAFENCPNIRNVTMNGDVSLRRNTFSYCSNLESVTLGTLSGGSLSPDMFIGCDNLKELNLDGYYDYYTQAPSLMVNPNALFRFNTDWTDEEELEHLRINLGEDLNPEDLISKWKYSFIGCFDTENSAYTELWNEMQFEMMDFDTFEVPTEEEVDTAVKQKLLESENRIRRLLGKEVVEEPVPYIIYNEQTTQVDENVRLKSITVRGVSGPMESVDLDDRMDLIVSDNLFYDFTVQEGALKNSPYMEALFLPSYATTVLQDGFLKGVLSDSLAIWNFAGSIPELEVKEEGVPFSFGIEDEKINIMFLIDKEALFDEWKYALVGYSSQETFEETMIKQLKEEQPELEEGSDEYKEALENLENKKLAEASGRLDTMFTDMSRDK